MRRLLIAAAVAAALGGAGCGSGSAAGGMSPEERTTKAVQSYKESVQLFNDGKIDEAIALAKKADQLQPGYTLLRYDLARMLLHRAERSDIASLRASEDAKQLHEADRHEEAKTKEDEAQAYFRRSIQDFREARDHLLWVTESAPYEPNAFYLLAKAYTGLGEFKLARKTLEKAIEVGNPTGPDKENLMKVRERLQEAEIQAERLKR